MTKEQWLASKRRCGCQRRRRRCRWRWVGLGAFGNNLISERSVKNEKKAVLKLCWLLKRLLKEKKEINTNEINEKNETNI